MVTPLTKPDFINILKDIYPDNYVNAMLNGAGGVYIAIYAAIFAAVVNVYAEGQREFYFGFADNGWLDLLAWGERGTVRASGESDAQFSARLMQPLDTITPQAMINAANNQLVYFGFPQNAIIIDPGNYPGMATDSLITFIDPVTGNPVAISATDNGAKTWSLGTYKAFFLMVIPEYDDTWIGFFTDSTTSWSAPDGSTHILSATDSINGLAVDGSQKILKTYLYSATWNQLNEIKAAGVGFVFELLT